MENLPHPKDLDFNQENLAAAWKKWEKEFNLFLIATESDMKPDKVKTSMFLTCIGSKGRDIHSTLDFDSPDEEMNLQTVIEKFDAYCEPRKNITFLRHKFFTCGQAEHQKFDEYVVELRQKAQQCEFGNLTDSLTKDILICGIRDMRLRERLLREPNLDLQKTIQAGQSAEQTRLQSRMLNATSETRDNEISRVYSQHDRKGAKTQKTRHMQSRHQNEQGGSDRKPAKFQAPSQHYVTNCHYCGYNHKRNKCPAFHKTCEKCKKQGHYAKMCKSRKFVHKVEIHTDDESDDDTHVLEMITANNSRVHKIEKFKTPKDIWTVELKVNNSNVTFKIDTGADATATENPRWDGQTINLLIQADPKIIQTIPETIEVGEENLVVFVEGRKPRCFLCGQLGHIRRNCKENEEEEEEEKKDKEEEDKEETDEKKTTNKRKIQPATQPRAATTTE
ncbi:K02A2.6-like family member retr-1 [Octopus vulgaris]|uniref:K02A2.6-like family member retr-1 n=1 Tax=Octopus vulgaris TaxID=6645 RepID=A0AA36AVY7_OCTVU|nr:K02A2.6-like family member retr-1 [Octopus vulgaris]